MVPEEFVIERTDDQFVIFRLEKVQASKLDPDFEEQIGDAGIDRGLYERMIEERALQMALSDKITAQLRRLMLPQAATARQAAAARMRLMPGSAGSVEISGVIMMRTVLSTAALFTLFTVGLLIEDDHGHIKSTILKKSP